MPYSHKIGPLAQIWVEMHLPHAKAQSSQRLEGERNARQVFGQWYKVCLPFAGFAPLREILISEIIMLHYIVYLQSSPVVFKRVPKGPHVSSPGWSVALK